MPRWVTVLLLALVFAACKRHIRIDDPQELEYHPVQVDAVSRWRSDVRADLQSTSFSLRLDGAEAAGWTVVTRFVHASDVQIRDRGLHYFGRTGEDLTDAVASSTRRTENLDANDEYPLLALVGAVNAAAAAPGSRPDFLVHTGDAADANSVGELVKFLLVLNELRVPWLDVVGNHDLFLMGNFTEDELLIEGAPAGGLPWVLNRARFMELHGSNGTIPAAHASTEQGNERVPGSRYHGFDCLSRDCAQCGDGGPVLRPYYSVSLRTTPPLRLVVLDTTIPHERVPRLARREVPGFGASGYVEAEQFRWLQRELASAHDHGEAVLVFGHHPLTTTSKSPLESDLRGTNPDGKADAQVLALLKADRNVLGYFGGHTHTARVAKHGDPYRGSYPLVEVIAPSLHEYPQAAFWVEVLQRGDELALRVRPVKGVAANAETLVAKRIATACEGARTDVKLPPTGDCFTDVALAPEEIVARVPRRVEVLVAEAGGREIECGSLLASGSAMCTPSDGGAGTRRSAGEPRKLAPGKRVEWSERAECRAAAAVVASAATCSHPGERSVALALASSVSSRTTGAGAARARAELAHEWVVPVVAPAGGAKLRVRGPPPSTLACRTRLDGFAEAPLEERGTWVMEAEGPHTLVVRCETVDSSCEGACDRVRPVEAGVEITVE